MKKRIAALLALVIVLAMLAACTGTVTSETVTETVTDEGNTEEMTPILAEEEASDTDAVQEDAAEAQAPASEADAEEAESEAEAEGTLPETDQDMITAQSLIGHPVEELYAAVGEPSGGAQYSKSCMDGADENAQDGMLYYDNFSVWTYKTDDSEIVEAVYDKY